MQRIPVQSSNLVSVKYEESSMNLEIEFKKNSVYQYNHVPKSVYDELMGSKSLGEYFHENIKDKYDYHKI